MRHRSAKMLALLLCILLACSVLGGCAQAEPQKYSTSFFDVFDTVTTIIGYADSQETFDRVVGEARQQFVRYHQVFDGYNAYEGVHNLYYVNQNAASGPVPAEPELMTLLAWIRDLQPSLEGRVNVAMGAVLRLWHDAREAGVAEVLIEGKPGAVPQKELFTLLCGLQMPLMRLTPAADTLEDVFLRCTADDQALEKK